MIYNLIDGGTINGYVLLTLPVGLAWLAVIGTGLLGVACMWLANRPQPRPDALRWIKHEHFDRPVAARGGRRRKR